MNFEEKLWLLKRKNMWEKTEIYIKYCVISNNLLFNIVAISLTIHLRILIKFYSPIIVAINVTIHVYLVTTK